jgi:hypothetical protein
MLSKPPNLLTAPCAYRQWVVDQFAQRCREAAAEQAEREAPRPAEPKADSALGGEREAPRPALADFDI